MKAIYLHGALADQFGEVYNLEVETPAEAIRALCANLPGFEKNVIDGSWRIIRGDVETGIGHTEDDLHLSMGSVEELHLIPAELTLGKSGVAKIVIGIAMVAAAFALPMIAPGLLGAVSGVGTGLASWTFAGVRLTTIALFGASMALSGVSMLLTPTPKTVDSTGGKEMGSYLFNGAVNWTEQGHCVPLVYGLDVMVGSLVISTAVDLVDITPGSTGDTVPAKSGLDSGYSGSSTSNITTATPVADPATFDPWTGWNAY